MQEAGDTNRDVKMEIQSELASINTIVTKIKQELHGINDIVRTDGSLDTALQSTIDSLVSLAKETDAVVPELAFVTPEENPIMNALSRITTSYITEKLQALTHE